MSPLARYPYSCANENKTGIRVRKIDIDGIGPSEPFTVTCLNDVTQINHTRMYKWYDVRTDTGEYVFDVNYKGLNIEQIKKLIINSEPAGGKKLTPRPKNICQVELPRKI